MTKLERLNKQIENLTAKRHAALRELRITCEHLRIAESDSGGRGERPWRICIDCGAEEEGWYCGWHVLVIGDPYKGYTGSIGRCPGDNRKRVAGIVAKTSDWTKYRKNRDLYRVGQSHANFGSGVQTYAQLTEP